MPTVILRERKSERTGIITYSLAWYDSSKWHYQATGIRYDPKKVPKAFHKESQKLLQSLVNAKQLELNTDGHTNLIGNKKNLNKDFILFFSDFINNYSKKDIRKYEKALRHIKLFINPSLKDIPKERFENAQVSIRFQDVNQDFSESFKSYLIYDAGLSNSTPQMYFKCFKRILRTAVIKGIIPSSPAEYISIKNNNDAQLNKEVLTIDEIRILKDTEAGNKEFKRAFLFACFTGIGYAEVKALKWKHISSDDSLLKIPRQKMVKGKTSLAYHDLPLSNSAKSFLYDRGDKEDNVFDIINKVTGKPYSDQAVRKVLFNWVKRAGIEKHITFYCARHTFGVLAASTKESQFVIRELMGHKSSKHTDKYINHVDQMKQEAVNKLPEL